MAEDEIWLAARQRMGTGLKQFGTWRTLSGYNILAHWHKLGAFFGQQALHLLSHLSSRGE